MITPLTRNVILIMLTVAAVCFIWALICELRLLGQLNREKAECRRKDKENSGKNNKSPCKRNKLISLLLYPFARFRLLFGNKGEDIGELGCLDACGGSNFDIPSVHVSEKFSDLRIH